MKTIFIIEYTGQTDRASLIEYFGLGATKVLLNGRTRILKEVQK